MRAAAHLVGLLEAQGATHIFGVPGESFLQVLDALVDSPVRFVTCRQEGGAAMAADAHGKLTGRPGIAMVTRGPGATNASAGLHVAYQDSTPMILFIGQVGRDMIEREAFQEIDYRRMFGQVAKWVAQIDDASRIQEYVSRAYRTAMSGRPGPVVLALPEDMLSDGLDAPPAPARIEAPRYMPARSEMAALKDRLAAAERPLVIAGGGGWRPEGMAALARFAEVQALPVAASMRRQSLMDNEHPAYVGHLAVGGVPYLSDAVRDADLILAIGPRLGEMTTVGYTLLEAPVPAQALAHVHADPAEIGRVYEPAVALVSDPSSFAEAAAEWPRITTGRGPGALRAAHEAHRDPAACPGDPLAAIFAHLSAALPEDAILCNGAGNYAGWLHRFHRYRRPGSQLAPTSGSMGYGLPAAVAAASVTDREVYAVAGDGCLMMSVQEMATAMQEGLRLTVVVVNNGRYGTIRAHQERHFPGRVSGTEMTNPDFPALARSFGAGAWRVEEVEGFAGALSQARSRGGLNLIEVVQDRALISPGKRLG